MTARVHCAQIKAARLEVRAGYQDAKALVVTWATWRELSRSMGVMKLHGANETLAAARRAVAASAAAGAARVLGQRAEEGGTGPDAPAEGAEGAAGAAGEPAGAARAVLRVEREFGAAGGGARLRMINDCVGFDVPFAQASLAPWAFATAASGVGRPPAVRGQLRVDADLYNIVVKSFEPLIEPFRLDVAADLRPEASGARSLSLSAKQRLEVRTGPDAKRSPLPSRWLCQSSNPTLNRNPERCSRQ